jgi:hypothetical protein
MRYNFLYESQEMRDAGWERGKIGTFVPAAYGDRRVVSLRVTLLSGVHVTAPRSLSVVGATDVDDQEHKKRMNR